MIELITEVKDNPGLKSKIVVLLFRLATLHARKWYFLYPLTVFFVVMNKLINEIIIGIEIPYQTKIGKGFKIWHAHAIVINKHCIIGNNFSIRQSCTIGSNKKSYPDKFLIGNNVSMGANSCILSDDIIIGNNVIIGAGVIVMNNVPDDHYVIGHKPIIKQLK